MERYLLLPTDLQKKMGVSDDKIRFISFLKSDIITMLPTFVNASLIKVTCRVSLGFLTPRRPLKTADLSESRGFSSVFTALPDLQIYFQTHFCDQVCGYFKKRGTHKLSNTSHLNRKPAHCSASLYRLAQVEGSPGSIVKKTKFGGIP